MACNITFSLERTKKGKPCIVVDGFKYRENRILSSGQVSWRCLGRTCTAGVKTNAERDTLIELTNKHSGDHPVTMRTLSPRLPTSASCSPAAASPSQVFSPLVSRLYTPTISQTESSCQTDDLHLKDKDELVERVKLLTYNQSCLVTKIQDITLQLEAANQHPAKLPMDQATQTEPPALTSPPGNSTATQTEDRTKELKNELQLAHERIGKLEGKLEEGRTPCEGCRILREEARNMIGTIRIIEEENNSLKNTTRLNQPEQFLKFNKINQSNCFIPTQNSFDVLANMEEEKETIEFNEGKSKQKKMGRRRKSNINRSKTPTKTLENKNKSKINPRRMNKISLQIRNVSVIGDSHARHLAGLVQSCVQTGTTVSGVCKPGAGLLSVAPTAGLPPDHCCVLMAGTNDVAAGNEHIIFQHFERILQGCRSSSSKILVCSLPTRHDLRPGCHINKTTIPLVNTYIEELCGRYEGVEMVEVNNIGRRHFTTHGLHLRLSGKRLLARAIVEGLAQLTSPAVQPGPGSPRRVEPVPFVADITDESSGSRQRSQTRPTSLQVSTKTNTCFFQEILLKVGR